MSAESSREGEAVGTGGPDGVAAKPSGFQGNKGTREWLAGYLLGIYFGAVLGFALCAWLVQSGRWHP